ncbi:MAG: hypothetical protein R3E84_04175 [Pseudomonadales bacterium]
MSEFNLIPPEYFARARQRRLMLLSACGGVLLVLLCGVGIGASGYLLSQRDAELQTLRQQKALSELQQQRLTWLQEQKQKLQAEQRLLASLSGGRPVGEALAIVEAAAAPNGVRFESLAVRRAGIRAEGADVRPPLAFTGSGAIMEFPASWDSLTQMTLQGEAKDHAALSGFVQALFREKGIEDVKIQRSGQVEKGVVFTLAIVFATRVTPA